MLPSLPAAPGRRSPTARRRRVIRWAFGVLLLAAAAVIVSPAAVGLGDSADFAEVIGVVVALAWTVYELYERAHAAERSQPTPADLAEQLATVVESEWKHEAQVRRLRDTQVLPLVWKMREQLADTPAEVFGRDAGRITKVNLRGQLEENFDNAVQKLAEDFARLPNQRLVVLGEPGAGKTVLALLLTLGLLRGRASGGPVPVLLSVSSWDPVVETLDDWLVQALATAYYGGRAEVARQLLDEDLLLPLLDGLDEIPESARRSAVGGINYAIRQGRPVVVTCRSAEYQDVIRDGAPVLRRAPVVEVEPVPAEHAIAYLKTIDWPAGTRWEQVYAHLRQPDVAADSPVGLALSTPLMVSLAGLVYQRVGGDPGGLLDTDRFDTRHKVEDHLTDQMIEAAYAPDRMPGGPAPAVAVPRWTGDQARAWLTSLARDLHRHRDRDLAWWLISQRMLSPWVAPGIGLGTGLVLLTLVAAWVSAFDRATNDPANRLYWTLLVGGGVGTGFAVVAMIVWYASAGPKPGRLSFRLRGSAARMRRGFTAGLLITGLPAVAVLVVWGAVITLSYAWTVQFIDTYARTVGGAAFGAALIGLALALHNWLNAPPERAARADPLDAIRQDQRSSLVGAGVAATVVAVGVLAVTAGGMALGSLVVQVSTDWAGWPGVPNSWRTVQGQWQTVRSAVPSTTPVVAGALSVLPGIVVALSVLLARAWPRFVIARLILALQRRLPFALPAFLDDARRRGVLRLTGGVYQFRHVRLQERLAAGAGPEDLGRPGQALVPRRRWRLAIASVVLVVAGVTGLTVLPKNQAYDSISTTYAAAPGIQVNDQGTMLAVHDEAENTIHIDWMANGLTDSTIELPDNMRDVDSITVSPDGRTVAVVGKNLTADENENELVRLWRWDQGRKDFPPVAGWQQDVPSRDGQAPRFLADGALLVVQTARTPKPEAQLWHLPEGVGGPRPVQAPLGLDQANFSDDGNLALLPGPGAGSRLWVPAPPQPGKPPGPEFALAEQVEDFEFIVRRPRLPGDGSWLVTLDTSGKIWLRDNSGQGPKELATVPDQKLLSPVLTSDSDGTSLAVHSKPEVVEIWNLNNVSGKSRTIKVSSSTMSIELDPRGLSLVAVDKQEIVVYGTASLTPVARRRVPGDLMDHPYLNRGGTVLNTTTELPETSRTQHWLMGHQLTEWTAPTTRDFDSSAATFTPDGCRFVEGGVDGVLRIWDLDKPQPLELPGHAAPITDVLVPERSGPAFRVITAAADGTVRFWNLPKSAC